MKKIFYRLIVALLGPVIVSSGCTSSPGGEYGAPHAEYKLDGTVVDEAGAPIGGIEIQFDETVTYSDSDGNWIIESSERFCDDDCYVTALDIDYEENGFFQEKEMALDLVKTAESDGRWDEGSFEQHNIEIVMEEIKE